MEANTYKKICERVSSFSRAELEQTLNASKKSGSKKKVVVTEILKGEPLEKPNKHLGGDGNDYFIVDVSIEDAEEIMETLGNLEAASVSPEVKTTPDASKYVSLLDRWLLCCS